MKASIRDLSSAVASVSGGLTGGSLVNAQIAGVVGQNAVENNVDLIQLISPASAAMLSKDPKHREAMKMAHQIRMMNSAITIATVGGGYVVAGIGYVAPEAIPAIYSACRVNPAGCTVVAVESTEVLAGLATGAVTVSNLPASAIKSTSKIGGKYAEEIEQIGKEVGKGSAKAGKGATGKFEHLELSERHLLDKVTIPKKTGNSIFTGTRAEALADLAEIKSGKAVRNGELFTTSSGRVWGMHNNSVHPVSGPGVVNITSQEYKTLVQAKKHGKESVINTLNHLQQKKLLTPEQVQRTKSILNLMKDKK
ncbi:MAG: VENN motif pre-toxin domain-containing protein [Snodgrassella sp.]|nr:VENN motif pre-toxin domain-containing protein [Snodgrassella sp.]